MGTIGERIDFLIKEKEKNRSRFAERVGVSPAYITMLIGGKNEPSDLVITSICREYRVSEEWLRHGTGEMFIPAPSTTVEKLCEEYDLDDAARIVLEKFIELDPEDQKIIIGYMCEVVDAIRAKEPTAEDYHAMLDDQIAKEKRGAEKSEA